MHKSIRWLPLLAALLTLTGCIEMGDWGDLGTHREDFHSTHPLNAGGRVSVESFNGSIELLGWDQNSVEVNGTKSAASQSALDDIKIDIQSSPDSVRIRAVRPVDAFHHGGVRFSIRVPRKAVLDLVASSNGRLEVEDVDGSARLRTSNGSIRLVRLHGDVMAQTSNGSIEAHEVNGKLDVRTSNGHIRTETTGGSLAAETSNGSITARMTNPAADSPVRLYSSNGHIELAVDGTRLPEMRASTSNSSILLRVPATADVEVRAHTSHSSVTSEFSGLHYEDDRRHSDMEGVIGHGGPLVELRTSNGSIRIDRL